LTYLESNLEGVKIRESVGKSKKSLESSIKKDGNHSEQIETCYTCGKKFDMSKNDGSRYRYGKFAMCAYCAEFYGFYFDDPDKKKREKI
jgi:hypothetical protein